MYPHASLKSRPTPAERTQPAHQSVSAPDPHRKHASKAHPLTKGGCSDVAEAAGGLDLNDSHCERRIGYRKENSKKLRGKCELVVKRIIGKAPGE
jgi:hypothetical protein